MTYEDYPTEPEREDDVRERDRGAFLEEKGRPVVDDEGRDIDLGEDLDPPLWGAQRPLLEEDDDDGIKLEGFDEDDIPRIMDAMGDDAAEPLQEFPGGTSATGSVTGPEHGGFPEREE